MRYPFKEIEPKWQQRWDEQKINAAGVDFDKPKWYVLDMFPYPSGAGLHVGHPEGYTATDIVARYKRLRGFNVLHPMGFDAFGLPTEQFAVKTGIHPAEATASNVANFKRQLKRLGLSYDWDREINTTDPSYFKWTQWVFRLIYNSWFDEERQQARPIEELPIPPELTDARKIEEYRDARRLAYVANVPVNWCEKLGTVLANEEVDEWRAKGFDVVRRPMRQWMLRITAYAERLLRGLDDLDWPHSTREMQRNWIGRSEGATVRFKAASGDAIEVFTTRPDTLFGATYLVLSPEHPLVDDLTGSDQRTAVDEYRKAAAVKSDLERTELNKDKSGVFSGAHAVNPATGEDIPIWIADYVLAHYGTGAIMAVPGHDDRDHEFALKHKLPIRQVVAPADGGALDMLHAAFCEEGVGINSANKEVSLNALPTAKAKDLICSWLEDKGIGVRRVQYKLRDWLFSRQRYWGEPIPIIHFEDGSRRILDVDELPLMLPDVPDFKPANTGESALARVDSWCNYKDPKTGRIGKLETNTMPQWAGSCWYYLRFIDPHNDDALCDSRLERYWMGSNGVDLYIGGAEHAVLHLLYARFWHKVLFDYGYVSSNEPFRRLFHQGMILGEDSRKMSKSLGNVISPDAVVNDLGADSLRLFEMFIGPLQDTKPWSTSGAEGVHRFLNRVWRMIIDDEGALRPEVNNGTLDAEQEFVLHSTIKKVSEDIESLSFNTAIAQMMVFVNTFFNAPARPRQALEAFLICLAPFAPHLAEELWERLGHRESILRADFPAYDAAKLVKNEVEIVLQVNSKLKAKAVIATDSSREEVEQLAQADPKVQAAVDGKNIRKIIYVPGKLVNIIAS